MGLTTYISKKFYVQNWDHYCDSENPEITVKLGNRNIPLLNPNSIEYVTCTFLQWRKNYPFNHWFVENVGKGGGEFTVEVLREFFELIEPIMMKEKTLVDQFNVYYNDNDWFTPQLEETYKIIKKELKIHDILEKKYEQVEIRKFLPDYVFSYC